MNNVKILYKRGSPSTNSPPLEPKIFVEENIDIDSISNNIDNFKLSTEEELLDIVILPINVKCLDSIVKCNIKIKKGDIYIINNTKYDKIFYWNVIEHDIIDNISKKYNNIDLSRIKYGFYDISSTYIDIIDNNNYIGIDKFNNEMIMVYNYLKYNNIKIKPLYYVAIDTEQIKNALKFIKYCILYTDIDNKTYVL